MNFQFTNTGGSIADAGDGVLLRDGKIGVIVQPASGSAFQYYEHPAERNIEVFAVLLENGELRLVTESAIQHP